MRSSSGESSVYQRVDQKLILATWYTTRACQPPPPPPLPLCSMTRSSNCLTNLKIDARPSIMNAILHTFTFSISHRTFENFGNFDLYERNDWIRNFLSLHVLAFKICVRKFRKFRSSRSNEQSVNIDSFLKFRKYYNLDIFISNSKLNDGNQSWIDRLE